MKTAVAGVGPIGLAIELAGVHDLVTHPGLPGDPSRVLEIRRRQRRRARGHRHDAVGSERLDGQRQQHGTVHAAGQRDEQTGMAGQRRTRLPTLFFRQTRSCWGHFSRFLTKASNRRPIAGVTPERIIAADSVGVAVLGTAEHWVSRLTTLPGHRTRCPSCRRIMAFTPFLRRAKCRSRRRRGSNDESVLLVP